MSLSIRSVHMTDCQTETENLECRLTLPSSGPAYGGPLKSNVRPRKVPIYPFSLVNRITSSQPLAVSRLIAPRA